MKFPFTINTLFLGLLALYFGYNVVSYYITPTDIYKPPIGALPVPIEVGKSKYIQSKNGDASMMTEFKRRKVIIETNSCRPKDPTFGFWNKSSTNGSLETYFLTSVYNEPPRDLFYDAEGAFDNNDVGLNGVGSGLLASGGDAYTQYCII